MKTPETNSSNVWSDNPWNLPYDLEHVNRVRAPSFEDTPASEPTSVAEESYAAKLAQIPRLFSDETRPAINDNSVPRGVTHNTPYSRLLSYVPDKIMRDDERPINDNTGRTPAPEILHTAVSPIEPPMQVVPGEQALSTDSVAASTTILPTHEQQSTPPEPDNSSGVAEAATSTPEVITRQLVSPRTRRVLGGAALVGVGVGVGFGLAKGLDWMHSAKKDGSQILPLPPLPKKSTFSTFAKRSYSKFSRDKK